MKILWFSNCILSKEKSTGTGSWLFAMRDLIAADVDLVNITYGDVEDVQFCNVGNVREYIIPNWKIKNGVPAIENIKKISDIVTKESPDIIHVWGIERYWALLFSRGHIKHDKVLLEMQGVANGVNDVYFGGLTPYECRNLRSFKTFIKPKSNLKNLYKRSKNIALQEREVLCHFKYIATQSDWVRDILSLLCEDNTTFFHSLIPLRQEFIEAPKWRLPNNENPIVFTIASYYVPYKGFHYLLLALSLLKKRYPRIQLRIAGPRFYGTSFLKGGGYEKYLSKMIDIYGLKDNVYFCGRLAATQIVEEINNANVVVNPSLVESYSTAAAESLYLGAPTVLSYAGAMVNFSDQKQTALYYSPMDYRCLAARIITMIDDEDLRHNLSKNAIELMTLKCNPNRVKERQLETYKVILEQ